MKTIRASELGTFLYCRRAWWYQKQGIESINRADMNAGSEIHRQHGRKVFSATLVRLAGLTLLLVGIILLVIYCTRQIF